MNHLSGSAMPFFSFIMRFEALLSRAFAGGLLLILAACAQIQSHEPMPLDTLQVYADYTQQRLDTPGLERFLRGHGAGIAAWPLPEWNGQTLALAALYLHPELRVAVAEWEVSQTGEIIAAQRPNPVFNMPLEWFASTESGESPWLIGAVLELILERPARRAARIDRAMLETAAARLTVGRVAWDRRVQVQQALAELTAAEAALKATHERRDGVHAIFELLQKRAAAGETAAFELSSSRLALQRLRLDVSEKEQQVARARSRLAAAVGVVPSALAAVDIRLPDTGALPAAPDLPAADVRGLALQHRYDIREALAEYAVQEAQLRQQIEQQYPDINLAPGFIFDQGVNVWALGSAWVLPLFHRHEGEIAQAVARRALLQQRFMNLQATIIHRVEQARTEYLGKLATYREAEALLDEAMTYRDRIHRQLQAGYADRLELLRAGQGVAEAEQAVAGNGGELLRAHASLEAALQYPLKGAAWPDDIARSLITEFQDKNRPSGMEDADALSAGEPAEGGAGR